jgi:RNA polymerase sigma-70 factor, ECF subfamily
MKRTRPSASVARTLARTKVTEDAGDTELLRLCAAGDRAAFGIFMNRHAASVHRFLIALDAGADDTEDALQECFVSAWRSAAMFQGSASARGWLLSIARNALRRQYRRRAGEPEDMESLERLGERAGWGASSDFTVRFEAREELEWALARLSSAEREAVTLRDLHGLSGEEAAEALGLSEAAMKSRLHRGRLRLMALLRGEEADHA